MNSNQIVEALSSIQLGTLVGWLLVLSSIGSAAAVCAVKLYKAFDKFKEVKDENENMKKTVFAHDEKISEISKKLDLVLTTLEAQNVTTMKELRRDLVRDGERYLQAKKMTIREWKSLHEMFDEYTCKYHQNSYVQTLIAKVDSDVEIVGALDEHGNDI